MRVLATAAVVLTLGGCMAQPGEQAGSAPAPGDGNRVEGVVRVVGSQPVGVRVVLDPEEGKQIEIAGPLRDELRALSGARVALTGALGPNPDPMADRRVEVSAYDILSVDGQPVTMGTVEGRSGEWTVLRTDAGEVVYLGGAADQLKVGQKVWVQGPRSLVVQSYGVLRP